MGTEWTAKNAAVLWQTNNDGIGEQALLVECYIGCIQITQDGQRINVNYEIVKELCKLLKQCEEPK